MGKTKKTKTAEQSVITEQSTVNEQAMSKSSTVRIQLIHPDVNMPVKAHEDDLGFDLTATSIKYDQESDTFIYGTGIKCASDKPIHALLFPRSSNCFTEVYLTNSVGVIDTVTYRGEIQLRFKNRTSAQTRAENYAAHQMSILPWWKKIFKPGDELNCMYYSKVYEYLNDYMEDATKYAPYKLGDKIGQLVFISTPNVKLCQVDELDETARGEGGFGSTGK